MNSQTKELNFKMWVRCQWLLIVKSVSTVKCERVLSLVKLDAPIGTL